MSSKPVNVETKQRKDESVEKLIRRFMRECKKEQIVREYLEKTRYYKQPSTIRRERKHRGKMRKKRSTEK
jgi:ribosomal protein S21